MSELKWATITTPEIDGKLDHVRCLVYDNGKARLRAFIIPEWFTDELKQLEIVKEAINQPVHLIVPRDYFEFGAPAGDLAIHTDVQPGYIGGQLQDRERIFSPDYFYITSAIILNGELLWNDFKTELNTVKWP